MERRSTWPRSRASLPARWRRSSPSLTGASGSCSSRRSPHVLAGYDTRPESEIQQGAFQGGFIREDGFAFLMFVVIQFHLGMKVTPATGGQTGLFDVPKVLRAAQRGAACKVDLSDNWDACAVADAPLDQLRAEYGIPA